MLRTMQEHNRAYRAVIKRTDKKTGDVRLEYFGPYGSKGSAKGQVTKQLSDQNYYDKRGVHTGWVQAATGHWEDAL